MNPAGERVGEGDAAVGMPAHGLDEIEPPGERLHSAERNPFGDPGGMAGGGWGKVSMCARR